MSRPGPRFGVPLVLLTALTVACSESPPTGPSNQDAAIDPTIGLLSSCSVAQDSIDAMLPRLFTPGSDRGTSVSTFNQMQKSLRQNKDAAALGYMKQIIDLAFKDFYANPSKITGGRTAHTAALMMDLVQGLYCINTGTLLPDFLVPLNGAGAVVTPGTPTTVALIDNGGKKRAASQFDSSDLPPATEAVPFYVVTISPISGSFTPPAGPLSTQLDQYGPFYEFDVEPNITFAEDVLTGVCINSTGTSTLDDRLRLAHNNATGPLGTGNARFGSIEIITEAAIDLSPLGLDCSQTVGFLQKAASYFLPELLHAAGSPPTTGGKVRSYSPFGAVDPLLAVSANSATSQSGTAGSPVTVPPSVKVQTANSTLVNGIGVDFVPTVGSGSVTGGTQTTSGGIATVGSWTINDGSNTLSATASAPGLSFGGSPVTFTATGVAALPDFGATGYSYFLTSDPGNAPEGWQTSSFPSEWLTGGAPFGTLDYCANEPYNLPPVVTLWGIGDPSFVLVRKDFYVPIGTSTVTIQVLVDNDVQVFMNGASVSDGLVTHENCANVSPISPIVATVTPGAVNKLAIIAKDRGGQSYLDLKVTLGSPPPIF